MANPSQVDNDVFIYTGGVVPEQLRLHITHVVIDKSVDVIETKAFRYCDSLLSVQLHGGVVEIGDCAFWECRSLQNINLPRVKIIGACAFHGCKQLTDVDIGDKLETIGSQAFNACTSLNSITIPSVRSIGFRAFAYCQNLTVAKFGEALEIIGPRAFSKCSSLTQIEIPVKAGLFLSPNRVFEWCENLTMLEVVGGIHKTIASLHFESWRDEMAEEINRINLVLPSTPPRDKTSTIINWKETVSSLITHYKTEHDKFLKEAMEILDKAIFDADISCGENFVVNHVLPYLQLK